MSHNCCSHEAHEHGDHDHDHDGPDRGFEHSLFRQVAVERVVCLNERVVNSGRTIFKSWEERMSREKYLESDVDEQLILYVPFNALVKLKAIEVRGGPGKNGPSKMKVWINRSDIDFDMADSLSPVQEWDLVETGDIVEYSTRIAKFNNVRSVTIFFPENFDNDDLTRVDYIGFKGEWEELKEDPIITVFELNANPADHPEVKDEITKGNFIQ